MENDAIIADYMAMLSDDLSGQSYGKAEHNRALQPLIGRGRGSIEYKHQNIGAVLKGIGETELTGYKSAFNYQASLEDAVNRWLVQRPGWYADGPQATALAGIRGPRSALDRNRPDAAERAAAR